VILRRPARLLAGACTVLAAACSPTAPSEPGTESAVVAVSGSPVEQAIVDLTNLERTREGLSTLRMEPRLSRAAQLQAEQMARTGRLDHVLADAQYPRPEDRLAAAGYPWQAYAENLAFGYSDARTAVEGWMNSPGHRANIVGTAYTEIGAGHAFDASGRPYYAEVFGRPR
jgi:uncharacterized protein YkwD